MVHQPHAAQIVLVGHQDAVPDGAYIEGGVCRLIVVVQRHRRLLFVRDLVRGVHFEPDGVRKKVVHAVDAALARAAGADKMHTVCPLVTILYPEAPRSSSSETEMPSSAATDVSPRLMSASPDACASVTTGRYAPVAAPRNSFSSFAA